jgi:hypothetical protein
MNFPDKRGNKIFGDHPAYATVLVGNGAVQKTMGLATKNRSTGVVQGIINDY